MVAANRNGKGVPRCGHRGIHEHGNCLVMEEEPDAASPEVLCGRHKLEEVWDRKTELVKETKVERLEERGIHVRKERQVITNTPESKGAEVRKCGVSYVWHA